MTKYPIYTKEGRLSGYTEDKRYSEGGSKYTPKPDKIVSGGTYQEVKLKSPVTETNIIVDPLGRQVGLVKRAGYITKEGEKRITSAEISRFNNNRLISKEEVRGIPEFVEQTVQSKTKDIKPKIEKVKKFNFNVINSNKPTFYTDLAKSRNKFGKSEDKPTFYDVLKNKKNREIIRKAEVRKIRPESLIIQKLNDDKRSKLNYKVLQSVNYFKKLTPTEKLEVAIDSQKDLNKLIDKAKTNMHKVFGVEKKESDKWANKFRKELGRGAIDIASESVAILPKLITQSTLNYYGNKNIKNLTSDQKSQVLEDVKKSRELAGISVANAMGEIFKDIKKSFKGDPESLARTLLLSIVIQSGRTGKYKSKQSSELSKINDVIKNDKAKGQTTLDTFFKKAQKDRNKLIRKEKLIRFKEDFGKKIKTVKDIIKGNKKITFKTKDRYNLPDGTTTKSRSEALSKWNDAITVLSKDEINKLEMEKRNKVNQKFYDEIKSKMKIRDIEQNIKLEEKTKKIAEIKANEKIQKEINKVRLEGDKIIKQLSDFIDNIPDVDQTTLKTSKSKIIDKSIYKKFLEEFDNTIKNAKSMEDIDLAKKIFQEKISEYKSGGKASSLITDDKKGSPPSSGNKVEKSVTSEKSTKTGEGQELVLEEIKQGKNTAKTDTVSEIIEKPKSETIVSQKQKAILSIKNNDKLSSSEKIKLISVIENEYKQIQEIQDILNTKSITKSDKKINDVTILSGKQYQQSEKITGTIMPEELITEIVQELEGKVSEDEIVQYIQEVFGKNNKGLFLYLPKSKKKKYFKLNKDIITLEDLYKYTPTLRAIENNIKSGKTSGRFTGLETRGISPRVIILNRTGKEINKPLVVVAKDGKTKIGNIAKVNTYLRRIPKYSKNGKINRNINILKKYNMISKKINNYKYAKK